jgi:hypothetical protein
MTPAIDLRREGGPDRYHDPADAEVPDPNDPIETPRGADPGPDPDAPHAPVPESTPVVVS